MIHAVLIFNNAGKPRLTKFYSPSSPSTRAQVLARIFSLVSPRDDTLCNFVDLAPSDFNLGKVVPSSSPDDDNVDEHDDLRVIYRHYATLYFAFVVDQSESELGILDLIQVLVESLDRCFENVCELDLIFHFDDVHTLLNCIITGGLVLDTSLESIDHAFKLQKLAKRTSENGTGTVAGGLSALTQGLSTNSTPPGGVGGGTGNSSLSGLSSGLLGRGGLGGSEGGGSFGAWDRISSSLASFRR